MRPLSSTLAQAALVAALTTAVYSIGLAVSPPHLTHDEIKFALQAKSIAESGRDLDGRLLPVYFKEPGFAVGRDPLCIYVTAAVLTVLPLSESSIRFATALVGGLGVGLIFALAGAVFSRPLTAWTVAFVLALSPTYYIHSRLSLSVVYPVPFTVLWLIVLHFYLRDRAPRLALATGAVLGLGVYSYLAAAIMMPLYLAATLTMLAVQRDGRGIRLMLAGFAVLMLPLIAWQAIEPDRYANILTSYRLYDADPSSSGGLLQQLASGAGVASRMEVFWDAFNPARVFFTGESSLQISTREVGSILTPVAVFLAVGVGVLMRGGGPDAWGALLLFGLITAPLPGVLMADVEIRRWLVLLPFVAMVAGVGVERMLAPGRLRVLVAALALLMAVQFAGFTRDYFGPYRERASLWFGGNIRAALESVLADARQRTPSAVYIANEIPWVEAYWRFYSKVEGVDLLDRTQYVQVATGEIPAATSGAVIVTPAPDAVLATRLGSAGWTTQRVVPDLDGRPSLLVATP